MNPSALAWPASVLAVLLVLLWGLHRAIRDGWIRLPQTAAPPRSLALVEVLALDARRRVQMVRCGSRHALILTGGTQDLLLGWLPEEPPCR